MSLAINRAEFIKGDLKGRSRPLRPPWALPEMVFRSLCNSCGDCIEKCPTGIIEFGRGRIPLLNFDKGECLFCGDCLQVCATGALLEVEGQAPWLINAAIDATKCLAFKGVECRSCEDPCESRAIKMLASIGGVSRPVLDASLCNGCGACYALCPVNAIEMKPHDESNQ